MATATEASTSVVARRLTALRQGLDELSAVAGILDEWADRLLDAFARGGTLYVAGNGGSATLASHLVGELVGKYARDRRPLPAVWLGADQCSVTAIANDYGYASVFERAVAALTGPSDISILMSTSGRSENLLRAAEAAASTGCATWAMTGPAPNPLSDLCDTTLSLPGRAAQVQELQQIAVHLICELIDERLLGAA